MFMNYVPFDVIALNLKWPAALAILAQLSDI